jgi:hypothetical protein
MERNVAYVQNSRELHEAAAALAERAVDAARFLITHSAEEAMVGKHEPLVRGGRKASMPIRPARAGEKADLFVEGEPMMQMPMEQNLTEG